MAILQGADRNSDHKGCKHHTQYFPNLTLSFAIFPNAFLVLVSAKSFRKYIKHIVVEIWILYIWKWEVQCVNTMKSAICYKQKSVHGMDLLYRVDIFQDVFPQVCLMWATTYSKKTIMENHEFLTKWSITTLYYYTVDLSPRHKSMT